MSDQSAQQPDQPIMFGKFDGYTNVLDRERLSPRDLALALDIDLDDDGQAHRRRGRTQVASGSFHSLFNADDGTVYGVLNGQLGIVNPNYSFVALGTTVGGGYSDGLANVSYVQIKDQIYFSNKSVSGIILNSTGAIVPWGSAQPFWYSPVIDPTSTLPPVAGKWLGPPPKATILAAFHGRIYLAIGHIVWATEHLLYNYVDLTKNYFQFEGDVTMLASVSDGLYVGTTEGLYFLSGASQYLEMKRTRVMDSPVIPGSVVSIPGELANPPQIGKDADTPMEISIGFMTTRGFCVAESGGKATNLTESRVFFPVAKRAMAFFRRQDGMNQYIVCADSEGDPLNGARIGDFIDAEIVRGNAIWVDIADSATATESTQ